MASERKCGYCQYAGHIKRNCEMLHSQRRKLFDHVVRTRKLVHERLVQSGYGVGALVAVKSYNANDNGIITTYANYMPRMNYWASKNIKYSKQVRLNLITPLPEEYHYVGFDIAVLGGGVRTVSNPYCSLFMTDAEFQVRTYGSKVISPSYDMDERITDELIEKNIIIPERLVLPIDKVGLGQYEDVKLLRKNLQM